MSRTDAPPGRANAAPIEELANAAAPKASANLSALARKQVSPGRSASEPPRRAAPSRLIDLERRARFKRVALGAV